MRGVADVQLDHSFLPPSLHVGTSSFSAVDWSGVFYPSDLKPHDFLSYYAQKFRTVEIDATWHFMPNPKMVEAWAYALKETPRARLIGSGDFIADHRIRDPQPLRP